MNFDSALPPLQPALTRHVEEPCARRALGANRLPKRARRSVAAVVLGLIVAAVWVTDISAADRIKPAPYALIIGTVWRANGEPAAGVTVKIRRADDRKRHWELISNSRGEFAQRVPAGAADYVVAAKPKGRKKTPTETTVHIRNDERQDVDLRLLE